jgi:hypothetical protein
VYNLAITNSPVQYQTRYLHEIQNLFLENNKSCLYRNLGSKNNGDGKGDKEEVK